MGKAPIFCLNFLPVSSRFIPADKRSVANCGKLLGAEICYLYDASKPNRFALPFAGRFSVFKPYILTSYVLKPRRS